MDLSARIKALAKSQFILFCCIGAINTAIHASIVIALVELWASSSTLANIVAFFAANIFSYMANTLITFRTAPSFQRYAKFLASSLVVLATTIVIAATGELAGIHYIAVMICLIVVSPILSFFMVKRFALGKRA